MDINRMERDTYDNKAEDPSIDRDKEWWSKWNLVRVLSEADLQDYFTNRYGEDLGRAAADFANLSPLPMREESSERLKLVEQVMKSLSETTEPAQNLVHPILAVIEATEIRTDKANDIRKSSEQLQSDE